MISFQLLKELKHAEDEQFLKYLVSSDDHAYIRFSNKSTTLDQIHKVQQHIEAAYNYRTEVIEGITGPVMWVYPEQPLKKNT